jgi:membrane protein YdbS with pleckstrin-like domain
MQFAANNDAKKVLMLWIAGVGILATALISLLAGLFTPLLLRGSAVVGLVTIAAVLWYPPRYVSQMSGSFDGTAVRAVKGVFFKQELFIPVTALRTFESSATPIQRLFHCRTIVLRFAGGAVMLPLLPSEQAFTLMKALENSENNQ